MGGTTAATGGQVGTMLGSMCDGGLIGTILKHYINGIPSSSFSHLNHSLRWKHCLLLVVILWLCCEVMTLGKSKFLRSKSSFM